MLKAEFMALNILLQILSLLKYHFDDIFYNNFSFAEHFISFAYLLVVFWQ